jgi:hypothetical protein
MEMLSARFQAHPPMIVRHLLQMNGSASRNNFVKGASSIRQLTLRANFQRSAVLFPNHVAIFGSSERRMNVWRVASFRLSIVTHHI